MDNGKKKSPVSVFSRVLGTAILLAVIIFGIILTVPKFFGGQFLAVVSGSMEPELPTGSLIYVQSAQPEEIEIGDIISFYGARDTSVVVTHRVVEDHPEEREFITKGDANQKDDLNPTRYDYLIGRMVFHVPGVGFVTQAMSSFYGKAAAVGLIGFAIVLHLFADSLDKKKKE